MDDRPDEEGDSGDSYPHEQEKRTGPDDFGGRVAKV
jgi:hypothetical protein